MPQIVINDDPSLVVAALVQQHNQLVTELSTSAVSGIITAETIELMV